MLRRIPALFALLLLLAGSARADVQLTIKNHTDGFEMMGQKQEAKDGQVTMWFGSDRVRRDDGDATMILRLDQNKLFMVDHTEKSYSVLDLPIDFAKLMPEGGQQVIEQMSAMMKMDVTVTPSDERKKIGAWDTRRIQVGMQNTMGMKVDTTMWVSKDVGVDTSVYTRMAASLASLQPGTLDWVKKIEQIDGFPVLQETTFSAMGATVKSREELVAAEKKDPAPGAYEPPAGYAKKDFDPLAGMQPPGQ
jgi:hypothetical protein